MTLRVLALFLALSFACVSEIQSVGIDNAIASS